MAKRGLSWAAGRQAPDQEPLNERPQRGSINSIVERVTEGRTSHAAPKKNHTDQNGLDGKTEWLHLISND